MENLPRPESIYLTILNELAAVEEILNVSICTSTIPVLREAAKQTISCGGKRFRPVLVILSAKICGYCGDNLPYLGAAVELIHTASIIHDDVLDEADLRRGFVTTNALWGNHLSILIGDYCLSLASGILSQHANREIIGILTDAAIKTTEGEVLESLNRNNLSTDVDAYLNIIRLKTGCLISAACSAGSRLAEAPVKLTKSLVNYGENIGLAFQIIDDIMDYSLDNAKTGKRNGSDLRGGKLTLPLIYALERCVPAERKLIKESLLSRKCNEPGIESIVGILNKYSCIEASKAVAEKYLSCAVESLGPFRPSIEKEALRNLADFVLNRAY